MLSKVKEPGMTAWTEVIAGAECRITKLLAQEKAKRAFGHSSVVPVRDAGIDVLVGLSLCCYGGTMVFPISETIRTNPSITENGRNTK